MARRRKKFYVVWKGAKRGVFDTWDECVAAVKGYPKARYKALPTREAAERAFVEGPESYWGKNAPKKFVSALSDEELERIGRPIDGGLCVDSACNVQTKVLEYRGISTPERVEVFRQGPFQRGSNNLGEFLAIVHGLAWLRRRGLRGPIYSDSSVAILWVRNKRVRSELLEDGEVGDEVAALVERALAWLNANHEHGIEVLKWETKAWGEIPADFGRKR